jgi:hypothetical protein
MKQEDLRGCDGDTLFVLIDNLFLNFSLGANISSEIEIFP